MIEISEGDVKEVDNVARDILQFPKEGTSRYQWDCKEQDSCYRALFGTPLLVITATWQLIKNIDNSIEIKHLFWTLVFLKFTIQKILTYVLSVGQKEERKSSEKSCGVLLKFLHNKKTELSV